MATLMEVRELFKDSDLQDKVSAALIIAVQAILDGTPTANDQRYASYVFANPKTEANKALMSVLATNEDQSVATILSASDADIKSQVANVIDTLSVAYNALQV